MTGRATCPGWIPGEDPGSDGPGVAMTSSFRVEIFGPRRRPRLGRTSLLELALCSKNANKGERW